MHSHLYTQCTGISNDHTVLTIKKRGYFPLPPKYIHVARNEVPFDNLHI
jgi:hypothetical protein